MTFLEVASMVGTWWIVAFLPSVSQSVNMPGIGKSKSTTEFTVRYAHLYMHLMDYLLWHTTTHLSLKQCLKGYFGELNIHMNNCN